MPDTPSDAEEPSIEEILSSIRQIISDDDEDDAPAPEKAAEQEKPAPKAEKKPEPEKEVLELTPESEVPNVDEDDVELDFIDVDGESDEDVAAFDAFEDESAFEPEPEQEERSFRTSPSSILSESAQSATMSSLTKLVGSMPVNNRNSYDGVTLEDIVRELLNPMLRDWMDDNLPPMVERLVEKEIKKLARRAMDE